QYPTSYGAAVVFELYRRNSPNALDHLVRILYRQVLDDPNRTPPYRLDDRPLLLSNCTNDVTVDGQQESLCTWHQFREIISDKIPDQSWERECENGASIGQSSSVWLMAITTWVVTISIACHW